MRLFVALPVPADVGAMLLRAAEELAAGEASRLRWSVLEDLHVTLQFLGETAGERVAAVQEAMRTLGRLAPLDLSLGGLGVFASAGVLLGVVRPAAELSGMVRVLAERLRERGFPPELRPYRPHVTLARTRRGLSGEQAQRWTTEAPEVRFRVEEAVLYESVSGVAGQSHFTPLLRVPLCG